MDYQSRSGGVVDGETKARMREPSVTHALANSTGRQGLYLHVGWGLVAPEGWVNIDASWSARLAKAPRVKSLLAGLGVIPRPLAQVPWPKNIQVWDVTRGLPQKSQSVAALYASHLLEHLPRAAACQFLEEAHRVLLPGGIIRLVVPDLESIVRRYSERKSQAPGNDDPSPAEELLESLGVFVNPPESGTPALLRLYRGLNPLTVHKWLYDEASLRNHLIRAGFADVRRMAYLESRLPRVRKSSAESDWLMPSAWKVSGQGSHPA